jgi:hypothetical protein
LAWLRFGDGIGPAIKLTAAMDANVVCTSLEKPSVGTQIAVGPQLVMQRARVLGAQAFAEGEIPFSGRSSNGGFWSRKIENALSFNGD